MSTISTNGKTGYPSIGMPWAKYYRKNPIRNFNVEQNVCQMIHEVNAENLDSIAINFMGIKGNSWTYRELFTLEAQLTDAFLNHGVKQGDESQLKGRAVPKYYCRLERMPYTVNNKQDFKKLEAMDKEYEERLAM